MCFVCLCVLYMCIDVCIPESQFLCMLSCYCTLPFNCSASQMMGGQPGAPGTPGMAGMM